MNFKAESKFLYSPMNTQIKEYIQSRQSAKTRTQVSTAVSLLIVQTREESHAFHLRNGQMKRGAFTQWHIIQLQGEMKY